MSKIIARQLLIGLIGWLGIQPALGQTRRGEIIGIVLNERGFPISGAQVTPHLIGEYVMRALVESVGTDENGKFKIDGLDWGRYSIYAGKMADGYGDTAIALYRTRPAPIVELTSKHAIAHAKVVIGPPAGVLVVSVRDALTNTPVAIQLVLLKTDGPPQLYKSEPPDFQVLLPANTDILVEIRQPGYKDWSYGKPSKRSLWLKSGEHVKLDVSLISSSKTEKPDH